jgi:bacterioferritin (cytochrome b1)
VDYLETQISLVQSLGETQYLQLQVEPGGH